MKCFNIADLEVYEMSNLITLFKVLAQTSSGEEQSIILENFDDDIDIEMRWLQQRYEGMTEDEWMCPVMREVLVYKDDVLVFNKITDDGPFSDEEITQMSAFIASLGDKQ